MGCKWSLVQIQSPRPSEGRRLARETGETAAFAFRGRGRAPCGTLRLDGNASEDGLDDAVRVVLPEKLLADREVAERLGACRATVFAMVERGEVPPVQLAPRPRGRRARAEVASRSNASSLSSGAGFARCASKPASRARCSSSGDA